MTDIDLRPPGFAVAGWPGQIRTITVSGFPVGYLTGKTHEWRISRAERAAVVDTEAATAGATSLTADITVPATGEWVVTLFDTTSSLEEPRLTFTLLSDRDAADVQTDVEVAVAVDTGDIEIELDVTLIEVAGGGGGGGQVDEVVAGDGISVDDTDPTAPIVTAEVTQAELDAEASARAAADTALDARLDVIEALGSLATDAELAAAIAALAAVYQPLDSDLTAIAALATTAFGRSLLTLADAAAGRTALGLGTAATSSSGDFQPIDADLTAIAALATTAFGRGLLTLADAAALRSAAGLILGTDIYSKAAVDGLIAALSGTYAAISEPIAQAHIDDATAAHSGTAIANTPAGNIAATNVQAAINELDTEKQPVDADLTALAAAGNSAILAAVTEAFLTAHKAKLDFLAITQAVDLDAIEARVFDLDASVILRGDWDASAGTFPGGGTAQAGASYYVTVAGTVDGVAFNIGDRVIAKTDNASTSTYAGNWIHADYTDRVSTVVGQTGVVTATQILTALLAVDGSGSGLDADTLRGTTPSAFILTLLDDAAASNARTTLGLGTAATAASSDFATAAQGTDQRTPTDGSVTFNKLDYEAVLASKVFG